MTATGYKQTPKHKLRIAAGIVESVKDVAPVSLEVVVRTLRGVADNQA